MNYKTPFKRCRIQCDIEGKVINKLPDGGYRVSVRLPGHKYSWWMIVPEEFVKEVKENGKEEDSSVFV